MQLKTFNLFHWTSHEICQILFGFFFFFAKRKTQGVSWMKNMYYSIFVTVIIRSYNVFSSVQQTKY